jgi:hypothetical protein
MPLPLPALTKSVADQVNPQVKAINMPDPPDFFADGGRWLVDATIKYGVNEHGSPLRLNPPMLEALELIGDFRVAKTYTTGAAQVFKTLIHWQLVSALITIGRKNFAWIYPQVSTIIALVPGQFKPIIAKWEKALGVAKKASPTDSKSTKIHQSAYGGGRFAAANNPTSASKERDGTAVANTNVVSFSSDLAIYEERSQYTAKSADAIRRRFLQSRIVTRPERQLGTPGNGGGIEREVANADYDFHPHVYCSGCGKLSNLSPLGWLFKSVWTEELGDHYFDEARRPISWHKNSEGRPYFGCPHCSHPITKQERLQAHFRCIKSGQSLRDVLDGLPKAVPTEIISAGITLSPLLRDSGIDPAKDLVEKGASSDNIVDYHQQELGIATANSDNGITIAHIEKALATPIPMAVPDLSIWGLDQGTTEHWLAVVDFYKPASTLGLTPIQIYEQSHRAVRRLQPVTESKLGDYIRHCHGGTLDNEPGREYAARIIKQFRRSFAFDQRDGRQLGSFVAKPGKVEMGGRELEVMLCNTHSLQDMLLAAFKTERVTLPGTVDPQDLSGGSATRHLTTSDRDPETGIWTRPDDHKDDLLKALMATELYYYLHCCGGLPSSSSVQFGDPGLL